MKKSLKPSFLALLTLIMGLVGLLTRVWVYDSALDEKGLCIPAHPAVIAAWVVTAVYAVGLFLLVRRLPKRAVRCERIFRASLCAAVGTWIGALGIAAAEIGTLFRKPDTLSLICSLVGIAAAACLGIVGYLRRSGARAQVALWIVPVAYFLLRLVSHYRQWSWASQISLFTFPLLACVLLLLAVYHKTALHVGIDARWRFLLCTLAAAFFALMSAPGGETVFYLCMAVWMLSECAFMRLPSARAAKPELKDNAEGV